MVVIVEVVTDGVLCVYIYVCSAVILRTRLGT